MLNARFHFVSTQNILGVVLLTLALVAVTMVNHFGIVPLKRLDVTGVGNDFSDFWTAARVIMLRESPYDMSETSDYVIVQQSAGQLGDAFHSPAFTTLVFLPLAWLPLPWAVVLWLTAMQVLLVASVALILGTFRPQPSRRYLFSCIVLALVFRYTFVSFMVGQKAALMLFLLVASVWAIRSGRNRLAGVLIAVSLIKPQVVFLASPVLLLGPPPWRNQADRAAFRERLIGFCTALVILMAVTLALRPSWPIEWIGRAGGDFLADPSIDKAMPSLRGAMAVFLSEGVPQYLLVAAAAPFLLWLGWRWWTSDGKPYQESFLLSLAIAGNLITAPYTREYDYVLLLFPAMLSLSLLSRLRTPASRFLQVVTIILLLLPYGIHPLTTRYGAGVETAIPVLMLSLVLLTERLIQGRITSEVPGSRASQRVAEG